MIVFKKEPKNKRLALFGTSKQRDKAGFVQKKCLNPLPLEN